MSIKTYLLIFLSFFLSNSFFAQQLSKFEFSQPKMGTTFRIILYASDSTIANKAANAAFKRIDELNKVFSDYDSESELSQLSKSAETGEKIRVSEDMWKVLKLSKKISRKSKGAFDITIGPLSKLWRRAFRRKEFPELQKIESAHSKVNYKWVKLCLNPQNVRIKKEGMRLDMGGIAKGYTVDAVYETLKHLNLTKVLIDGGGDLYIGEAPPGENGWKVQLFKKGKNNPIQLETLAIASSGDTYKFLEWKGKKYSHIIDPRTGFGVTDRPIVNITAPNCTLADALASALSVLNEKDGRKLIRKFPGCKIL